MCLLSVSGSHWSVLVQSRSPDHADGFYRYPARNCLEYLLPSCDTREAVLALCSLVCHWWKGRLLPLCPIYWGFSFLWWCSRGAGGNRSSRCLLQELTWGMLGVLKLHSQVWMAPGDTEWGSRGQRQLARVPSTSWLVRNRRVEEDSVFKPLLIVWDACIGAALGVGHPTALWVWAVAELVLPFRAQRCFVPGLHRYSLCSDMGPQDPKVVQGWKGTQAGVIR